MILVKLIPRKVLLITNEGLAKWRQSLGWGAVWAVAVPLVSILLLFTIIGVPLAIALVAVYVVGIILAPVLTGVMLGWLLSTVKILSISKIFKPWSVFYLALLGILLYRILIAVPYVGWAVALLGTLWAWGAMLKVQRKILSE